METDTKNVFLPLKKLFPLAKNMKKDLQKIERVVFCSDFLRINEGNIWEDKAIIANIDMIYHLFAPLLSGVFAEIKRTPEFCVSYGTENGYKSLRFATYSALGLPVATESWAYVFGNKQTEEIVHAQMEQYYRKTDLVLCYETPPYMIWFFRKHEIPFIDVRLHAVRFLRDYMFSFYSNVEEIQKKIELLKPSEVFFHRSVAISRARTARIFRDKPDATNNVLFLGQTTCDNSLIQNNRIANLDDVLEVLVQLSIEYGTVYYKRHPYNTDEEILQKIEASAKNICTLEHNVYDLLTLPFSKVVSMSSGANVEAQYFGCNAEWILKENWLPYAGTKCDWLTTPIYRHPFTYEFWKYIISDDSILQIPGNIDYTDQALKFVINMKWGR